MSAVKSEKRKKNVPFRWRWEPTRSQAEDSWVARLPEQMLPGSANI
jgi:hypothetical protein